ncbi:MAG: DoxX family protein [Cyclobacteriaceae bacterium]|nr:DoxX family protein [Cyclobacteriaceae bacterium]
MKNFQPVLFWTSRIIAATIMAQTLYYKFSASAESVYIFTTVGMEPWGRIGIGVFELIAAVLILIPSTVWLGSILAVGLMAGALGMHLTMLGIDVNGDGGQLFLYALVVLLCGIYAFWQSRKAIPAGIKKFLPSFFK